MKNRNRSDRIVMCRCGCQRRATKAVMSVDIDGPFTEYCCQTAANYMYRHALETGVPFLCEDIDIQAGYPGFLKKFIKKT